MATRRRAREVAFQLLFQHEGNDCSPGYTVQLYKACFGEGPLPDAFSVELFEEVVGNLDRINEVIERSSENWRLDRMSRVDRNILRIGVHEILGDDTVPVRVAINEAVELAKRFGTEESASFVNGILDRIARDESRL